MNKILTVKRNILFQEGEFQGFCPIDMKDYSDTILNNFEYLTRNDDLENDRSLQQIIPYVWLVNPISKQIFLYKRSTGGAEGRLHNKYSGGIGGHIDKETEEGSTNPITDAMMRELKEEVTMQTYPNPKYIGFLNDDSNNVGQVHFGIVALAETAEDAKPAMHMSNGKFYTINEIESLISDPNNELESWSQFSWPYVKDYIESLK